VRVILVCGRVGSGKTTVAGMLREMLGAELVEADEIGHAVLELPEVQRELTHAFGGVLRDGTVDRPLLAERAFSGTAARETLNTITHPRLIAKLHHRISAAKGTLLVVAALPKELDLLRKADIVVEVRAPEREILARNRGRFPMLEQRLRAQELLEKPDVIIDNGGPLEMTRKAVQELADQLSGTHGRHRTRAG